MTEEFKKCIYCEQRNEPEAVCCNYCAAILPTYSSRLDRIDPFFYMGYVVWALREQTFRYDTYSYFFYLGARLVETITVDRDVVKKFVPECSSPMQFIFDLFKLAQGEKRVLKIVEANSRKPATFEIRRVDDEYLEGLTIERVERARRHI